MKVYQVGGSVRDELMGITPRDYDYIVVDSSIQEMLDLGYTQVGKDFPVFIHPQTKEEYALARKEKKVGLGYQGFSCETSGVTLSDDLFRRDLTINSIAKDELGLIIDPFGGVDDLKNKVLRHVSPHFSEDPLRVLRVARFQARYPEFKVAEDTKKIMAELVKSELTTLSKERFEKEFSKAFKENSPFLFLSLLNEVGFFSSYLPEWKFTDKMSLVNTPASVDAKLMALIQDQDAAAFLALSSKLGFKSSLLKECNSLYPLMLKKPFDAKYVVSLMLKTKAHQKKELYTLISEVLALRKEDLSLLSEVLSVAKLFTEMDFSFVEALPPEKRREAVCSKLLEEYQALKN